MRKTQGRNWKARQREVVDFMKELPRDMNEKFIAVTPIRSGNARKRTSLKQSSITADYSYAGRLEKDSGSKQAPEGMSAPTIDWARQQLRKL